MDTCTYLSCVNLFIVCIINVTTLLLSAHVRTYTSSCGALLVDMSVPSDSIVSPSLRVQWGYTPLLRAVGEGHADIAHFLLSSGSVFNERNSVSARVHVY